MKVRSKEADSYGLVYLVQLIQTRQYSVIGRDVTRPIGVVLKLNPAVFIDDEQGR